MLCSSIKKVDEALYNALNGLQITQAGKKSELLNYACSMIWEVEEVHSTCLEASPTVQQACVTYAHYLCCFCLSFLICKGRVYDNNSIYLIGLLYECLACIKYQTLFLLGYNCFTMLCQFLLSNMVSQLYICIYPLPLEPPLHPPCHPSRSSQSTEQNSLCFPAGSHQQSILHMVVYICQCYSVLLSQFIPLSLPLPPPTILSSTSALLFLPCKQEHQYHFSTFHRYGLIYDVCFVFLTYFSPYDRLQVHLHHFN